MEFASVVKASDQTSCCGIVVLEKVEGKRKRKCIAHADFALWVGGKYVF